MKFHVLQSQHLDCVFVRAIGRFCVADIILLMKQCHQLELFRAGAPVLTDARFVDFEVPIESVITTGKMLVLPPERGQRCVAFVVDSQLGYGMLRAMTALREREGQLNNVFRSFREAFEWIGRPAFDAPPPVIETMFDEHFRAPKQDNRFNVQIKRT